MRRTRAPQRRSRGPTYSAGGEGLWQRAMRLRWTHGNGAAEFWAKEWRQRNGEVETFCLHSFASIPLPNPLRGLGFRFRRAKTRWTGGGSSDVQRTRASRRRSVERMFSASGEKVRWQADSGASLVSCLRLVTSAATFSHSLTRPRSGCSNCMVTAQSNRRCAALEMALMVSCLPSVTWTCQPSRLLRLHPRSPARDLGA